MKRILNEDLVLMGQITPGTKYETENKLQLFDGKFTTGYRVKSFDITSKGPTGNYEYVAKLSTQIPSTLYTFEWNNIEEIAWAGWNISNSATALLESWVRPDNMIVEDLYITAYQTGSSESYEELNYMIVLEKYEFSAWDGAFNMVRNQSQAGSS